MSNEEFLDLLMQSKESLIAIIAKLVAKVNELEAEKPVTLPELPNVGQYVIRDSSGTIRLAIAETKALRSEVEGIASLISSSDEADTTLYFYLNNRSQVMSVWRNGAQVELCQ